MDPPRGFLATFWSFICFLPYFLGLLLLGIIKGIIFCPLICLIMTIGNSAIILGLWPVHIFWTYYCTIRAKLLGPVLKLVICICISLLIIIWPILGIVGSAIGAAAYGFLSPIFATFDAVGVGKSNEVFHCFYDGTWSTIEGSFTIVRDLKDVCFHSYFSIMDDLRERGPSDGKYHELRLLYLPGAIVAVILGIIIDVPIISIIAIFKSFYMLFRGWHRLFQDLIGREGPFLETICVPFAGLAILLWPLAVIGAVLASTLAGIFVGSYAGVIVYQESSFWFGLCYIIASLSIYDEYSNDVLDMPEGSCFPRPQYQRNPELSSTSSHASSFSRPGSLKNPPSRTGSVKNPVLDLKPLELIESLFEECHHQGEIMVSEGLITVKDLKDAKSSEGSRVISIGLPAYCLLQGLMLSAKANISGVLLSDHATELTTANRPKDTFFDWFLNPFLIIKEQIKAEILSASEEKYLSRLVLLSGDQTRLISSIIGPPPESTLRRAELDALARRLQGITKSISRYPTFRRRFDTLVKNLSEDLARKNDNIRPPTFSRSKSAFARILGQKSSRYKTSNHGPDQELQPVVLQGVDIE